MLENVIREVKPNQRFLPPKKTRRLPRRKPGPTPKPKVNPNLDPPKWVLRTSLFGALGK